MKTFWTSDHHFDHFKVIEYSKRPYKTVHEMNEDLIMRWNSRVSDDDLVWYIGDFAMNIKALRLVKRLNGVKHLIPGNHDQKFCHRPNDRKKYYEAGFELILTSPTFIPLETRSLSVMMWHLPYVPKEPPKDYDLRYMDKRPKDNGATLFHGHCHETWKKRGRMINVGVDQWQGFPVTEEEILDVIDDPREFIVEKWQPLA